ncbi:oxygenase MpaB family protein [Lysobacter korlensis]|uniref:Oxygenase MpaB family protein n=1 Tax=Lysobacter korlensis TaxID=553636 RepID=A0ABV6RV02_9GAMM
MRRASIRDVSAEGALLAGAGAAILLQVAEPTVAAGVARHSDFATRPLLRLRTTLSYVYAVVFGRDDQVATVRAMVDRAHASVPGAADPELQLWVAATLYATGADVDERIWGPLDPASAEQVYRDNAVLGTALQMPPELWPPDLAGFRSYWEERRTRLEVTADARKVMQDLLHPTALPWWLRPGMPLVRLLTAGLLPAEIRAAYGLPWSRLRQQRFGRAFRVLAAVYRPLPRRLRQWPMHHFLKVLD